MWDSPKKNKAHTTARTDSFLTMLLLNTNDSLPLVPLSFYATSTEKDEHFSLGEASM